MIILINSNSFFLHHLHPKEIQYILDMLLYLKNLVLYCYNQYGIEVPIAIEK